MATVMANGIPQNSSSPKLANTAKPAEMAPNAANHTFVLTQSNLRKQTVGIKTYLVTHPHAYLTFFFNTSIYLKQDRIEIEMARKYVTEKRGITESELVSNSFCLDIDVK